MEKTWLLLVLLFSLLSALEASSVYFRGGIGFGFYDNTGNGGGGGGNMWMGGGGGGGGIPTTGATAPGPSSTSASHETAFYALQAWKSAITDDPNRILSTWMGPDVCSYEGIFCSTNSYKKYGFPDHEPVITGIDLNRRNLRGSLVKELALLEDLSLLHLNSNQFFGPIPAAFKELFSLQELDLSNNNFSGGFPSVVLEMPSLIYLDLRFNNFTGTIPEELFEGKLDAIFLNDNQFEGELPQRLGSCQASVINLANNRFTGSMPLVFGAMSSRIKEILFLNNDLTGCIPEAVGFFSEVKVFDVSYNSLTGHLPDSISCLEQIEVLNLGHNQLSGVLSDMVCSLSNLMNLTVSYNFFSALSQECSKLFYWKVGFDFSDNCIPHKGMQRPAPECMAFAGGDMSCFRIESPRRFVCGSETGFSGPAGEADLMARSP
ncbi:hypothetical protein SAY87_006023 [Trapa incisa]|uniref:Cell wall hydroxyproline-rich glycoprotein n=1 Tax=Trapa incisa TaxID=236973 RepID=A0AAN7K5Q6_9MYRT|nr:hypothetical protein SAY87_006023 [Trapa incisa]